MVLEKSLNLILTNGQESWLTHVMMCNIVVLL